MEALLKVLPHDQKMAVQRNNGTGIPQIQMGAIQLKKERRREEGYKRRRETIEREVQKIRERKFRQE